MILFIPGDVSWSLMILLLVIPCELFLSLLLQVCTGAKSEQQSKLAARKV